MTGYRLSPAAARSVEDIHFYLAAQWGEDRADRYLRDMVSMFERIAEGTAPKRPIPAELAVAGHMTKFGSHMIYWRDDASGTIVIAAVLHQRMDRIERLRHAARLWDDGADR